MKFILNWSIDWFHDLCVTSISQIIISKQNSAPSGPPPPINFFLSCFIAFLCFIGLIEEICNPQIRVRMLKFYFECSVGNLRFLNVRTKKCPPKTALKFNYSTFLVQEFGKFFEYVQNFLKMHLLRRSFWKFFDGSPLSPKCCNRTAGCSKGHRPGHMHLSLKCFWS